MRAAIRPRRHRIQVQLAGEEAKALYVLLPMGEHGQGAVELTHLAIAAL